MSKVDLEIAENLEFEDGDIAITIKPDGAIGKVILPKMDLKTQNSAGYRAMLCLLYTSPSPRDATLSRMPSSA